MIEEAISFSVPKGVFYNPNMTFCRSMFSLAVGAVEEPLVVCDAFAASGIRGIRYAKENKNVKSAIFVDLEKKAANAVKNNARRAGVKARVLQGSISRMVFDISADFVEVDPFGTPSPYLHDVFRVLNPKKHGYLSVTATDTAVLCGGKIKAAMKNYHSKPLNNEFTHETGLRILLKKIAETAAEFNMGMEPLFSLSDRHYLKTLVRVRRNADEAYNTMKKLGYVSYCGNCGFRECGEFPERTCRHCAKLKKAAVKPDYAGPLWLGELHRKEFLEKMARINKKRDYKNKEEIEKKLFLMRGEIGMPPYFYDIHHLSKKLHLGRVPKIGEIITAVEEKGGKIARTHFSPTAVKTDLDFEKFLGAILDLTNGNR